MAGETNLNTLLRDMTAHLHPETYVFATLPVGAPVPATANPRMVFHEAEGTTLILLKSEADALSLPSEFPCRMITLDIHSALEAVGFIARIANVLAEEGMGVNPVAGYFHDHLFVPEDRAEDAIRALKTLSGVRPG